MTYLYAGLGMAMLTAVMAMFELSLRLDQLGNDMNLFAKRNAHEYDSSQAKNNEKEIYLKAQSLYSNFGILSGGKSLCDSVKTALPSLALAGNGYNVNLVKTFLPGSDSASGEISGCRLVSGKHQVILARDPGGPMVFYSCIGSGNSAAECPYYLGDEPSGDVQ